MDVRKFTYSARGSGNWKKLYNERTAVERVNTYLNEYFRLNNVRHRTGKIARFHFESVTLIYNASKFPANRINAQLNEMKQAA